MVIDWAMFCNSTVLPVRGGATIGRAGPLPDRRDDIDDAGGKVLLGRVFDLELQPFIGIKRRQIVEMDLVTDFLSGSSKLIVLTLSSAK